MSAFIDSIMAARTEAADDAAALSECAAKLQEHNRSLKEYIAKLDAESVKEAMAGFGCDDKKLIVALCSRTKSQLKRTAAKYRELYDEDLREAVRGETSGDYGKLVDLSLAPKDVYFADMIDKACVGIGCSETTLIELFVTTKNADIAAGRKAWEGRTDKNLIDYLDDELTDRTSTCSTSSSRSSRASATSRARSTRPPPSSRWRRSTRSATRGCSATSRSRCALRSSAATAPNRTC